MHIRESLPLGGKAGNPFCAKGLPFLSSSLVVRSLLHGFEKEIHV